MSRALVDDPKRGVYEIDDWELFVEKAKPLGEDLRSFGTKKNALVDGISGFVPIFQRSLKVTTCELSSPHSS